MKASVVASVAAQLFALAACGSDSEPPPVVATLGGLAVEVYPSPARIVISAGDVVVFDGLPGGEVDADSETPHVAAAVRDGDATYEFQFGSFRIEDTADTAPWSGVREFGEARVDGASIVFELRGRGGDRLGTGAIVEAGDGELTIELAAEGDADRASIAFGCQPDEHFLGLGGQSFDVDHRGQTVPIWVQEDGIQKSEDDFYDGFGVWFIQGRRHSTHTPMPMFLSSRGYAMALDTPYRSIFAMCSEADDVVRIEAWENRLALRLFYGPSPAESIAKMTAWVGRPDVPPAFAFAPWLDAIYGEDNVRRVAQKLRAEGVASSVIWSEDWRGGNDEALGYTLEEDWEVDRDIYPNFETLAGELHDEGFKFFIYHNTFLDQEVPAHAEAVAGGHTIKNADGEVYLFDGVKFRETTLLDMSSPAAVDWAKQKFRDSLELGADGYMADFAEWLPTDAVLASGEDATARHNLYPVDWAKLNKELFDDMYAEDGIERLFFVRAAYLGSQSHVSVVWAGDQQTDWCKGDGMPSVIPIGIGLGVTGFPYYGHDIAGYMSQYTEPTSRELWYRWVTLGALSPVMRTHHGRSARDNWSWESDLESTAHFARWAQLHMRLHPYLYGLASDAADTGLPMFRPLAIAYPDFDPGWTSTDQFMLGDRIIVAPIVEQGATSRQVMLPAGDFYPLLGGAAVTGTFDATAAIEDIPAYVPAGAVLVLLPDGVDTAVEVAITSAATPMSAVADDREVWLYPGGASSWTEAGGELRYDWDGAAVTTAPTTATFESADTPVTTGPGYIEVEVSGPGTIRFEGGATLVIEGGQLGRVVRARLFTP